MNSQRKPIVSRAISAAVCLAVLLPCASVVAQDVVELKSGTQIQGRVVSEDADYVKVEVTVNGRKLVRRYPKRIVANVAKGAAGGSTGGTPVRSAAEVRRIIQTRGATSPDWLESTRLNIPATLDLSWPMPPPKGWNNSKNVGQFIWDRINPNPGQWRNGIKLMHNLTEQKGVLEKILAKPLDAEDKPMIEAQY